MVSTPELPEGMIALGYTLICYDDGTYFAVSEQYGGTIRSSDIEAVIESAREMYRFLRWLKRKQQQFDREGD